jgi:hypothetical protein
VRQPATVASHCVAFRKPVLPVAAFESSSISRIITDAEFTSIEISCVERCRCLRIVYFQPACRVKTIK